MANPNFEVFKNNLVNKFRFNLFMLTQLPSAWFAGLKLLQFSAEEAAISIRYKWFNKNPFNSVYVAVLNMPAEVSTGILCMGAIYKRNPAVSMLVVKSAGSYLKKATGNIVFPCKDGTLINEAVDRTIETGEGVTVDCNTTGTNEQGVIVAEFCFTWSFKARSHPTFIA